MSDNATDSRILSLTAQIVSAHVSNNALQADALPGLIQSVFKTLTSAGRETTQPGRPQPAVPVKRSVFADYIVCLEDGKKLKMLKRHLKTAYNMTPDQYRERWELPASYPMVAPTYAAHRSTLAKKIGLGTKRAKPPAKAATKAPAKSAAKSGRGRKAGRGA
jgi:predicted transcriptional regulator